MSARFINNSEGEITHPDTDLELVLRQGCVVLHEDWEAAHITCEKELDEVIEMLQLAKKHVRW